ncbi:unnamed protein product [Musa acuminata var. zebrina]
MRARGGMTATMVPLRRSPTEKPPFTLGRIKKAIPPHCFDRSVIRSFSYVFRDLLFAVLFLYVAVALIPKLSLGLALAAWPLYWVVQGCVLTGLWVIAHECGHHAFSDYSSSTTLSASSFIPPSSSPTSPGSTATAGTTQHRLHRARRGLRPQAQGPLSWYSSTSTTRSAASSPWPSPSPSAGHCTSPSTSPAALPRFACHFDPYGPIYTDRERAQIFISDAGLMATSYALYRLAASYGFWWLARVYGVPLLIVNGWLVLITYLQHTHPALPTTTRASGTGCGALATVDRDYGVLNKVFHNITDTTSRTTSSRRCRTTTPRRRPG